MKKILQRVLDPRYRNSSIGFVLGFGTAVFFIQDFLSEMFLDGIAVPAIMAKYQVGIARLTENSVFKTVMICCSCAFFWNAGRSAKDEVKFSELALKELLTTQAEEIRASVRDTIRDQLSPYDSAVSDLFRFQVAQYKEKFLENAQSRTCSLREKAQYEAGRWVDNVENQNIDVFMHDKFLHSSLSQLSFANILSECAGLLQVEETSLIPTGAEIDRTRAPYLDAIKDPRFRQAYIKYIATMDKLVEVIATERRRQLSFVETGKRMLLQAQPSS